MTPISLGHLPVAVLYHDIYTEANGPTGGTAVSTRRWEEAHGRHVTTFEVTLEMDGRWAGNVSPEEVVEHTWEQVNSGLAPLAQRSHSCGLHDRAPSMCGSD